jgi:hypothetical protein
MKKNLNKELQVIKDDLAKRTAAANKLGENAKAEADAVIARLNEAVAAIETAVEENEQGDDDKSAELQAKMDEVLAELADLRKKTETAVVETENRRNKIVNSTAYAYDFLQVVKNSANASEFRANVNELAVKNAITPDTSFLPGSMVKAITDGFAGKHRLLELVDWTGLPMFRALYETGNAVGEVHTKGAKKIDQALTFSAIDIRPDIIYKYLTVDKVMLKQCETPEQANVLLEYITKELLDRVLFTVEQGILSGTEPFIGAKTVATSETAIIHQLTDGLRSMDNYSDPVLICTKDAYFNLLQILDTQFYAGSLFGDDFLTKALRVREIIPANVKTTTEYSLGMWLMQPEDYKLVGDLRPDQYNSFNLEYNKEQYLTEIYIGGGSINPNNFIELINVQ